MQNTTNLTITGILHETPPACPPRQIRNVDYHQHDALLTRMDELLLISGLEAEWCARCLVHHQADRRTPMTPAEELRYLLRSQQALRCHLLHTFTEDSLRGFSRDLVSHTRHQAFCGVSPTTAPSKSQLARFAAWLPGSEMRALIQALNDLAGQSTSPGVSPLGLATPLDLATGWGDSTALVTPIHHPVDWLLIRDAIRTLIHAVACIRQHGLRCRMDDPTTFLTASNRLCIQMTQEKQPDKPTAGKRVLREMLSLLTQVDAHARRHLARLREAWAQTDLTMSEAARIAARITGILTHLPQVRTQVECRLLHDQPVPAAEKLLSLYHPTTCLLVRGKTGHRLEYGHPLWLVEQRNGLILDWDLAPQRTSDGDLAVASLARLQTAYPGQVHTLVTDRGCDGPALRTALSDAGIRNAVGPRSPREYQQRTTEPFFRALQRRRSQTEARISMVKHDFLGVALRAESDGARLREVTWGVLMHNLWVLARVPQVAPVALAA